MKSRWERYLLAMRNLIVLGTFVFIIYQLIIIFYPVPGIGFSGKTFWDWMELLIIPLVLATGAFFLQRSERKVERELAVDRQREQALQSYIAYMTELIIEKSLRNSESPDISFAAKARTLTVLRGLDPKRKRHLLEFLRDADLIGGLVEGRDKAPIFNLAGADFSYADLRGVKLRHLDLAKINLQYADLRNADIFQTSFSEADMRHVNLQGSNLHWAYLHDANMSYANMRGTVFWDMTLKNCVLKFADLRKADFFHSAGIIDCDLTGANVKGARIPEGHLTATSFKGTIMPNGKRHK